MNRAIRRAMDKLRWPNIGPCPPGVDVTMWCMEHDCCPHGVSYNRLNAEGRHDCKECDREIEVGILSGKVCADCHGGGVVHKVESMDKNAMARVLIGQGSQEERETFLTYACTCEAGKLLALHVAVDHGDKTEIVKEWRKKQSREESEARP